MSYYSVAAVFQGDVVFHRDTPLENGVNGLVIEASSKLMQIADETGEIDDDGYVIVEQYWESYSEPEVELFLDMSEVEDVLHHQYASEETIGYCGNCLSPVMLDTGVWCNNCGEEWDSRPYVHYAESAIKNKGKVRTMSGKPHKPRKLTQDQGISPEEAAKRISLKSETDSSWTVQHIETYDTIYGTRIDGKLYNQGTGETAEFTDAEIEPPYIVEDMWDDYDYHEDYEDEDEDEDEKIPEIATIKDAEEDAYAYAYNEGHADSRKEQPYKPHPVQKQTGQFRKIYKQRAENTWDPKTFESENKVFKSPLDDKYREIL